MTANVQIMPQLIQLPAPIFTHGRQCLTGVLTQLAQPVSIKLKIHVLYRVQTEAIHFHRIVIPLTPAVQFRDDLGIGQIETAPIR